MNEVISVENLGKLYRLGEIGTGTISHDLKRWWAKRTNQTDPFAKVGIENDRTKASTESSYVWALQNVSFSIQQGEVVGVIGRNGAGKSTLLKILSRITSPTTGRVRLKGRIGSLLEVGTGFHPEMTGRENVYMNGTILGMSRLEIALRFDDIVDFAGVAKYIDTPVKRYSSGMVVRLGFAVAAFLEPEILIVDEVLAVGDAEFQKRAIGKMKDISHDKGRTVLVVSHNMTSIQNLCTSAMLMSNGRFVKKGQVDIIVSDYLKLQIAASSQPLADRADRSGSGVARFSDTWIEDDFGNKLSVLISGMAAVVCIAVTNTSHHQLRKVLIGVGIDDSYGRRISVLNNELTNQQIMLRSDGLSVVRIRIPRLPLKSDTYSYTLFCSINGEVADWIGNAGSFFVENGDYFRTGQMSPQAQGNFLIDHGFSVS